MCLTTMSSSNPEIYTFNKYLLNTYCMSDSNLGTEIQWLTSQMPLLPSQNIYSNGGDKL